MRSRSRFWFRFGFLAPACLLYGILVLIPLVQSFQLSTFRLSGLSDRREFVGFDNFIGIFKNGTLAQALQHNAFLLVGAVSLILVFGYLAALAAGGAGRMAAFLRNVYLFPHVISLVVVAILWQALYNPQFGLFSSVLRAGQIEPPVWLNDSRTALPSVLIAFVWYVLGFSIMVLQAGLKGISPDVHEAAELDGAVGARRFWNIQWPLTWSTRRIVVIHTCIGAMNTFALVRLMTNGGPDRATEVALTYLYERGFQPNSFFGEATAIAVINFIAVLLISGLVMVIFGRNPVEARTR